MSTLPNIRSPVEYTGDGEQIGANGKTDRSRLRAEPGGVRVTAGEAVADGGRAMCTTRPDRTAAVRTS